MKNVEFQEMENIISLLVRTRNLLEKNLTVISQLPSFSENFANMKEIVKEYNILLENDIKVLQLKKNSNEISNEFVHVFPSSEEFFKFQNAALEDVKLITQASRCLYFYGCAQSKDHKFDDLLKSFFNDIELLTNKLETFKANNFKSKTSIKEEETEVGCFFNVPPTYNSNSPNSNKRSIY